MASRLGGATLSSFTDAASIARTAWMHGLAYHRIFGQGLKNLNPLDASDRELARSVGLGIEEMLASMNRYNDDGLTTTATRAGKVAKYSNAAASAVMRASGLNALTAARKQAFSMMLMDKYGKLSRSKAWKDLEFKERSNYRASNGELVFGGINGFTVYHPDSIRLNPVPPPVYFTKLTIFDKEQVTGAHSEQFPVHISEAESISLDYNQSVFTIDFTALNYTLSNKNQFKYKLEGFNDDWTQPSTRHSVTYTNLNPGRYVLKVIASNNDGFWNPQEKALVIYIVPPFWMTWFFCVFLLDYQEMMR